jgi:hypothetical protein
LAIESFISFGLPIYNVKAHLFQSSRHRSGCEFQVCYPSQQQEQDVQITRSFTQSKAQSYGLTGFVENKPNGKVSQGNSARA